MEASIPNLTTPINDQKTEPRIASLKRFLDRLLSESKQADRLDEEDRRTAAELGLTGNGDTTGEVDHASLIELTRRAIRETEPVRPADQGLETMSAPPAQPAAVP